MGQLAEIGAVTKVSLRSLSARLGASCVVVLGIGTMVGVTISLLALGAGARQAAANEVSPSRVIVMSAGAPAEYAGAISSTDAAAIVDTPGIRRDDAGRPLAQPSAMLPVEVTERATGAAANVSFRGTGPQGLAMDTTLHLIAGRMYRPGLYELIVGNAARAQYRNLDVGDVIKLRGTDWTVVGAFTDRGGLEEGMLIGDADTLIHAFNRRGYQSVIAELESPSGIAKFREALAAHPELNVVVESYRRYLGDQVSQLVTVMNFVSYVVGGVMALGAVAGTFSIMLAMVDTRRREIATLRALGFSATSVLIGTMAEAATLALVGGLLGIAVALVLFGGHVASRSGVTFRLDVTPELAVVGIGAALAVAMVGALVPALRAARMPIAAALKAV